MVLLTFYCGLRCSELLSIKTYDFNWKEWLEHPDKPGYLKIRGKGRKQRRLPVIPSLMNEIYDWLKESSKELEVKDSIFKISERRWQKILSGASKQALEKETYPHMLRHSCASYLRKKGLNLEEIRDFLGHKSIVTTQLYLHKMGLDLLESEKKIVEVFESEN